MNMYTYISYIATSEVLCRCCRTQALHAIYTFRLLPVLELTLKILICLYIGIDDSVSVWKIIYRERWRKI